MFVQSSTAKVQDFNTQIVMSCYELTKWYEQKNTFLHIITRNEQKSTVIPFISNPTIY